jgi:antitoxin (DNA-binding transcriptional repressor) of toxin-antitoxin stability system
VKTIAALDLRNDLEGVVKALKRGERMALTYRGELVGELSPPSKSSAVSELPEANKRALEALQELRAITARDPDYRRKADAYLQELREDRIAYGDRNPS